MRRRDVDAPDIAEWRLVALYHLQASGRDRRGGGAMRLSPKQATVYIRDEATPVPFRWVCADSDLWREILNDWKRATPHWTGRRYLPTTREWYVPYHSREYLYRWLDAWFSDAAQQWEEPRARTDGADRGRSQHAPNATPATGIEDAYRVLCLTHDAPPDLIQAAYRWWAKQTHPDHGGDTEAMIAVNRAVAALREQGRAS